MVSKKVSRSDAARNADPAARPATQLRRPSATGRTAISSARGGRARSHPLAPAHVGELGAVALLVMGIIGVALVITGLAVLVEGLTVANAFADSPPPNVSSLGTPQVLGGLGVMMAGAAEVTASALLLLNRRRARLLAIAVDVAAALLAAAGAVLVSTVGGRDVVLTASLLITAVALGLAAVALQRHR